MFTRRGRGRLLSAVAVVALACGVAAMPVSAVVAPRSAVAAPAVAPAKTDVNPSGLYVPVPQHRLMDTATGLGGSAPAPGHATTVNVLGTAGVPASGVTAVAIPSA